MATARAAGVGCIVVLPCVVLSRLAVVFRVDMMCRFAVCCAVLCCVVLTGAQSFASGFPLHARNLAGHRSVMHTLPPLC